jgi:DNA adenine methylase
MSSIVLPDPVVVARPFLKWAGGKGQLIPAIGAALPGLVHSGEEITYIEPFIGSGAVLFRLLQQYPSIKKAIINDINPDLVEAYRTTREQPGKLIECLDRLQDDYYRLETREEQKEFYLARRTEFNDRSSDSIRHTGLLIFLNRTCYNGLYRVNSRNQFNVPFGTYAKPKICDAANINAVSRLLQRVTILNGDYSETVRGLSGKVFCYLDPPYKPISKTASFNSYSKDRFDDAEQRRLRTFCDELTARNICWLMSNSDPRNHDPEDTFFDDLYAGDALHIGRVAAKRNINSNGSKRGDIAELLISNYSRNLK